MRRLATRTLAGLLAAGLLASAPSGAAGPAPVEDTFSEELDVDRVLLPVTLEGRGCATLEADDIRVLEDRSPRPRVTALERHTRARIHALVLDTSASMGDGDAIVYAIEAAQRYVEGLPLGERIMLVTFDDDVRLRLPLTALRSESQRRAIVEDLGQLTYGGGTAMRDAVYMTLRYLSRFPQRKAMILLTDGVDVSSPQRQGAFFDMATDLDAHDVAIFPIGWNIRRTSKYGKTLRKIATRTGGVFYPLEPGGAGDAHSLQDTFTAIRELLLQQVIVEYVADSWGQGAQDEKNVERDGRIRRGVKVKIAPEAECRPAYYRTIRWVTRGAAKRASAPLATWPPASHPVPSPKRPVRLIDEWATLYGGSFVGTDAADLFVQAPDAAHIEGRSLDFVEDPGGSRMPAGYVSISARKRAFTLVRPMPFGFPVPRFARLSSGGYAVEHALYDLLDESGWLAEDPDAPTLRRVLAAGPTLPALREPLAATLYDHFPDYQRWIAAKIELERRHEVERFVVEQLVDLWRGVDPKTAAELDVAAARGALRGQMRAGASGAQGRVWAHDLGRVIRAGSSPDVGSLLDEAALAEELAAGPSDDLLGFAVEAVLATRLESALGLKVLPKASAEFLAQIRASRPILVQRALSQVGASDQVRYTADWLEDISPYTLATRLERVAANARLAGTLGATTQDVGRAWAALGALLTGRGHRTHALMLPVYDARRERVGFHRVGMPRPEFRIASAGAQQLPAGDSVHRREPFPRRPWGLLLLDRLERRAGASGARIARIDHRVLDRRQVVPALLARVDSRIAAMGDWGTESFRAFLEPGDESDVHERMDRLRKRRAALQVRRDELAGELRTLFREPVAEVEILFEANDPSGLAPRLKAYLPTARSGPDDEIPGPVCVLEEGAPPLGSDAAPCGFVEALRRLGDDAAPIASR